MSMIFICTVQPVSSSRSRQMGAGLAVISLAGSGVGIGYVFGSLMLAYPSNPSLQGTLFIYAMVGFALTEVMALFGLMMAFKILYG